MKNKTKIMILICIIIISIASYLYYSNFVYGSHITTDSVFVENVEVNGSIVTVTGNTAGSGIGFAGYDTVWVADELWIKPRYSIVSKSNPSGKMEIEYDIKNLPLHKVYLVGADEEDKKLIWPQ